MRQSRIFSRNGFLKLRVKGGYLGMWIGMRLCREPYGFWVWDFGFRASGLGLRFLSVGVKALGFGCGLEGLGT